jgi:hypothetical protein
MYSVIEYVEGVGTIVEEGHNNLDELEEWFGEVFEEIEQPIVFILDNGEKKIMSKYQNYVIIVLDKYFFYSTDPEDPNGIIATYKLEET